MSNINKNIIKQAGAAVANATNKAAGLSASTPEPGTVISAIQLVNGGRTIGPAALAHFTESVRNKLLSLQVDMEPIQDFNGYDHPWPAGGGKNKFDVSKMVNTSEITINNGVISVTGSARNSTKKLSELADLTVGETYILTATTTCTDNIIYLYGTGANVSWVFGTSKTITQEILDALVMFYGGKGITSQISNFMIRLASETDSTFAPYSNICPIIGRTWLSVYVGPTSAIEDASTYLMDWTSPAGTVYAGSADIVTGDIKAAPYYASYNGETLVGPWVSSMDEYDPEGTPTTGAQVVDLGGTMTEYHITGQDIITFVGDNYICSDSGDVTITE